MLLEVGKSYITRDGLRIINIVKAKENNIFFVGEYYDNGEEELIQSTWRFDGHFVSNMMPTVYDLVKEDKGIG